MSKFISKKYDNLTPYVPGEQPKEKLIKLNTNESPFPPSPLSSRLARQAAGELNLYSDPDCKKLKSVFSDRYGIDEENLIFTNGSDEILNFAVATFCDRDTPAYFPEVTYGFYKVYCELYGVPYTEIKLNPDLSVNYKDYLNVGGTVIIANPNAQTGTNMPLKEVEEIVASNPKNVVIVDEAYVDFGGESARYLTKKYPNLLVVGTFSKSRSLAGARLGYGIADKEMIEDLNKIRYSTNPFDVNKMTEAAGIGSILDDDYFTKNCKTIIETREYLKANLIRLGFDVVPSSANFLLAKHKDRSGKELASKLREKGILIRRFDMPKISEHIRITIGSKEETEILIKTLKELL